MAAAADCSTAVTRPEAMVLPSDYSVDNFALVRLEAASAS